MTAGDGDVTLCVGLVVFVGPYLTVSVVWGAADVFNGLMAFPNLVAPVLLSPVVVHTTRDYFRRH